MAGPAAAPPLPSFADAASGPLLAGSPWPEMRRDSRNTAESPIRGRYRGDEPWSFRTARGIFSTPVIGDDGTVYVGSADGYFYALGRDRRSTWKFRTGGIIDAAAALGQRRGKRGSFPITIGSGDETLYQLRGDERRLSRKQRIALALPHRRSARRPASSSTGGRATSPTGRRRPLRRQHRRRRLLADARRRAALGRAARNSVWTTPAFDAQGNSYWGSVDLYAFSLDPNGQLRWQTPFAGYVTSSPALGSDGTVYVGAFDGSLHALDPATGLDRWSFPTADHIYSSPALASDAQGATTAIYIASADGSVYAVRPTARDLALRHRRAGALLAGARAGAEGRRARSSTSAPRTASSTRSTRRPARGGGRSTRPRERRAARPQRPQRLAGARQARRLHRRRARPGLVRPLRLLPQAPRRPLLERSPGQEFGDDVDRVFPVTPGRHDQARQREKVPAATVLGTRLVVREDGATLDARMLGRAGSDALVSTDPPFRLQTELSGDGQLPVHPPRRVSSSPTPTTASACTATGRRRSEQAASTTRCTFRTAPRQRRRRCRSVGRKRRRARSSSAAWRCRCRRCCRASTRSASTPTT